jgi:hypothetical protein
VILIEWVFEQPAKLISLNEHLDHRRLQNFKKYWREAGWAVGNQLKAELRQQRIATPLGFSHVQFQHHVYRNIPRDGHNWVLPAKWTIDGLVIAKLFLGDSTEHISLDDTTFLVTDKEAHPRVMTRLQIRLEE